MSKNILRTDLNDMVTGINLKKIKTRYNERKVCLVTLFNGETIEFKDSSKLYDLFDAYKKCGKLEGLVKSRKLVEEFKTSDSIDGVIDEETGKYICVLYELTNGRKYRLFVKDFEDLDIINLYYDKFKEIQKTEKSQSAK